ncbi:Prgl [Candidatus Regiella insecticola 5.15]|uniref:Prgl n=1 Tax=Candidatus Regiella insecticola 5.15 TaxID=1005043 RepID=G2GWF4_9ENTR|nr:hypothetical protein [Candidatus Regiella insecticola]EGY29928.1 Prgl [Candidatus Regiella insecticola 5.15]
MEINEIESGKNIITDISSFNKNAGITSVVDLSTKRSEQRQPELPGDVMAALKQLSKDPLNEVAALNYQQISQDNMLAKTAASNTSKALKDVTMSIISTFR